MKIINAVFFILEEGSRTPSLGTRGGPWTPWTPPPPGSAPVIKGPEGEPYSNQRVRPFVRPSVCSSQIIFIWLVVVCVPLLQNYLTDFSNADTNLPREQCRFATYTSLWPSPHHDYWSRSRNTSILWIRCLTGSSLYSLLLQNYSTNFSNADANLPR